MITGVVTLIVTFVPPALNSSEPESEPEPTLTTPAGPTAMSPTDTPPSATATAPATTSPTSQATDGPSTFLALRNANVDFTVPEKDLKQWLESPGSTPYPSVSEALLGLLADKRLRRPVAIDVIVYNYENTPGAKSPRTVDDVDLDVLRAAVLEGFNTRHSTSTTSFESLVE